jgi:hypothetical protein
MLMTPCALTTFGAATADVAAAATLRKLRRVGRTGFDDLDMAFLSLILWARRWRLPIFYQQTAYSPLSGNYRHRTTVTIAYLSASVT